MSIRHRTRFFLPLLPLLFALGGCLSTASNYRGMTSIAEIPEQNREVFGYAQQYLGCTVVKFQSIATINPNLTDGQARQLATWASSSCRPFNQWYRDFLAEKSQDEVFAESQARRLTALAENSLLELYRGTYRR